MSLTLASLPKGYRFSGVSFDLSPEWVGEYVAAVEDEAIGALGPGLVPPMAVVALAIRALLEQAALPPGTIHLGQELSFVRAARVGARLLASAEVASRGERQGWVMMGVDLLVEEEGAGTVMTGRATVTFPLGGEGGAS